MVSDDLSHWSDIFMWRQHHYQAIVQAYDNSSNTSGDNVSVYSSCGRQKGPSMMTRYARSYSLQKGPSLEDSVE